MKPHWKRWAWGLVLAPLAFGLWRLRFDVEVLNLLPSGVPVVQGLKLHQQHFAHSQELIITVRAADAESAESAARQLAESLRGQSALVRSAFWQPPWQERPEHSAELLAWLWLNQPPAALTALTNRLAPDRLAAVLAETRDLLTTSLSPTEFGRRAYDPFGLTLLPDPGPGGGLMFGEDRDWFASADGTFRILIVEPRARLPNYRAAAAWLSEINAAVARCQRAPEWPAAVSLRYTGGPAFVAEIAQSMERDMRGSVLGTLLVIAALFGWAHRRWLPLVWLVTLLMLIVAATVAIGGFIFGTIHVISLGFAAVLMGLSVDYALVLYQESLAAPDSSHRQLRRTLAPAILWSAGTTAGAFALLNFGGLPGLSQLGSLVAIGILLAATVMLFAFLPVARRTSPARKTGAMTTNCSPLSPGERLLPGLITLALLIFSVASLSRGLPSVDRSTRPLQLADCPAQTALDEMQTELSRDGDPLLLLVSGHNEQQVALRLADAQAALQQALTHGQIRGYQLPTALWPHPDRQESNRPAIGQLVQQADVLRRAALNSGFTSQALVLTEGILQTWQRWLSVTVPNWPTNASCQWLLNRVAARGPQYSVALGMVQSRSGNSWSEFEGREGVWLTGWPLLSEALLEHVRHRLGWLMAAMLVVLVGGLAWAFRSWREVVLSLLTLGFSLLVLLAVLRVTRQSWNLMNLMALPLLLGAGVDYTIHVQLALRRHGGDIRTMRRITGRALLLCAGTTVAGFGSLMWSGSVGLSSLGFVCALGVLLVFATSTCLLPAWWLWLTPQSQLSIAGTPVQAGPAANGNRTNPSTFYRAGLWRLGLALVRVLPATVLNGLCRAAAEVYFWLHPHRRHVVADNLLPVVNGDVRAAARAAHRLFREFALKLADLWRFESGVDIHQRVTVVTDWAVFQAAQARGRGVVLITAHLGNWELGGPLLAQRGVKLVVLTQAEPGDGLTELRMESRSRWGIETLVIGNNSFAFVDVIKRLQEGATLALLIDRPPAPSAVTVELFGRPFPASVAAAELARATGCALFGVTVVRAGDGYTARLLPEFSYDRRALGDREARRQFTQQILRAFEPEIRQHLDQWFHFIPVWPEPGPTPGAGRG